MNNNYYQQPYQNMAGIPPMNNGVVFNQVQQPRKSSTPPEGIEKLKRMGSTEFKFDEFDELKAGWDFRDTDGTIKLEIIDPETDFVRCNITGEEFHILFRSKETVVYLLDMLKDIVSTTKLCNSSQQPEMLRQIYVAFGVLEKLLPIAYESGIKNFDSIKKQLNNMITGVGYQGNFGSPYMYNGMYGSQPNYYINDTPQPPNNINGYYGGGNPNYYNNNVYNGGIPAPYSMGMPTAPVGGTYMNSPFVQNAPQPMQQQPVVPFPGQQQYQPAPQATPVMNNTTNTTAAPYNPPISSSNNSNANTQTTGATVKV